jgi:hypothetical protein
MGIRAFFARRCGQRHGGWLVRRVSRKLKLDQTQQDGLRRLQDTVHQIRAEAREGWAYRRESLLTLLSGERLDRDEALRVARVPSAMVNDALPKLVEAFGDFFDKLTVEQRGRLREMVARRTGHHCGAH